MEKYFEKLIKQYPQYYWIKDNLENLDKQYPQYLIYKKIGYEIGYEYEEEKYYIRQDDDSTDFNIPIALFDTWEELFENFKIDGVPFRQIYLFDYDKPNNLLKTNEMTSL